MSMSYSEAYPPRLMMLFPPLNHSTLSTFLRQEGATVSCVGVVVGVIVGAAVGFGVAVGRGVVFDVGRGVGVAIGFLDKNLVGIYPK